MTWLGISATSLPNSELSKLHGQPTAECINTLTAAKNMKSQEIKKVLNHAKLRRIAVTNKLLQLALNTSPPLTDQSQDSQKVASNASSRNHFTHWFHGPRHARSFKLETFATLMKFQMKATTSPVVTLQWSEVNALHQIVRPLNVWNSATEAPASKNTHLSWAYLSLQQRRL